MTIFSDADGFGVRLTKAEEKAFLLEKPIYKLSMDSKGYFEVTLKMKRIMHLFKG